MTRRARLTALLEAALALNGALLLFTPLLMVLVQFGLILSVNLFALSSVQIQESLAYINALMFLGGAGYTALQDGHVRVDIFYSKCSQQNRAHINRLGTLALSLPFLGFFWWTATPFVLQSWAVGEKSVEASGLPFVYILKSVLLLFALSLSLHALLVLLRPAAPMPADIGESKTR